MILLSTQAPGVIVSHSPASSGRYIGSPRFAILPNSNVCIRCSQDGDRTWAIPDGPTNERFRRGRFHCAPCPTLIHDGLGGAHTAHNANYFTYHRIIDCRRLPGPDRLPTGQQLGQPK